MTDTPSTPRNELELIRRLADLADTTTVDEGAWDAIQRRLTPTANPWARRSPWRLAVMAAAAVVLVVGALAMTRHDDDGSQVDIQEEEDKDRVTTTTVDDDEDVTPTTDPDATTTTLTPGVAGQGGEQPPDETASGPGSGGSSGGARGSSGTGSGPGTGSGGGGGSGTTIPDTTVPPVTLEDGRAPAVSVEVAGNTVQTTLFTDRGAIWMNVWHGTEWVTDFAWNDQPGQNCLVGEGAAFTFPGAGTFTFDWGIVRNDAAEVRIVMQDGSFANAAIGAEHVPGVRAWLGVRPAGTLEHYEVRDGAGNVLHTATPPAANSLPDTCPSGY